MSDKPLNLDGFFNNIKIEGKREALHEVLEVLKRVEPYEDYICELSPHEEWETCVDTVKEIIKKYEQK